MEREIDICPKDLLIVQQIVRDILPPTVQVWVFGSRVTGKTKRSSDLDLAIDAGRALTRAEHTELDYGFEESDLPYRVDVVDLYRVSPDFKVIIEREKVLLPKGVCD